MVKPTVFSSEEIEYFDIDRQHSHEFYVPVKGSKKRILSNLGPTNTNHILYTYLANLTKNHTTLKSTATTIHHKLKTSSKV